MRPLAPLLIALWVLCTNSVAFGADPLSSCGVLRQQAQDHLAIAAAGGPHATAEFEQAADTYLALWHTHGLGPLMNKSPISCDRMDEVLEGAARALRRAHKPARAISTYMILLNPEYGMDRGDAARRAAREVASIYFSLGLYDQAAEWHERYAMASPAEDGASNALFEATLLRLRLGQDSRAVEDLRQFVRSYERSNPARVAALRVEVAAGLAALESWDEARRHLVVGMRGIQQHATVDQQIVAHATLAQAYVGMKRPALAATESHLAVRAWASSAARSSAPQRAMQPAGPWYEAGAQQRVQEAVATAALFLADQRRIATFDRVRLPPLAGPKPTRTAVRAVVADRKAVDPGLAQSVDRALGPWIERKTKALEACEVDYKAIQQLSSSPPARQTVVAAARIAALWADLLRDLSSDSFASQPNLEPPMRAAVWVYLQALRPRYEPMAVAAADDCVKTAIRLRLFEEEAHTCEQWLYRMQPRSRPPLEEILPPLGESTPRTQTPPISLPQRPTPDRNAP